MGDVLRVVLLVALAVAALATAGFATAWWMEPGRRLRRALTKSLGVPADAEALSPAEGRAAALDFDGGQLVILWRCGAHGLVFDIDEVEGGEIIVDGHLVARVRRGAPRKQLDVNVPDAERVTLRLMFEDRDRPDFELSLWNAALAAQTGSPPEAMRLGRRWLSHLDALLAG